MSIFKEYEYTEAQMLAIVSITGNNIQYFNKPSKKVQIAAVRNNPYALMHIQEPCAMAKKIAIKAQPILIHQFEEAIPEDE